MDDILQRIYEARCQQPSDIMLHLPRLHAAASRPGVRVLELGVRSGNSTAAFLAAADQHGGWVISVDIVAPKVPAEFWDCGVWRFVKADDLTFVHDDPVDVLFIDTSHHFDQTLAELHRFHDIVCLDGCIILHDTELRHPEGAPPGDPDYPVAEAIRRFIDDVSEWQADFYSGSYGLAVLTRRRMLLGAA
jgi:cephalosporin hydroxylase